MNNQDAINNLRGIRTNLSRRLSRDAARMVGVNLLDNAVRRYGDERLYAAYASLVGTAMNYTKRSKYKVLMQEAKQRVKGRLNPDKAGYQFNLFNALCGLESLYASNYKFGLSLILTHLGQLDQQSISALAEQVAAITHGLEMDDTATIMQAHGLAKAFEAVGV
jgi:hypothetical protein